MEDRRIHGCDIIPAKVSVFGRIKYRSFRIKSGGPDKGLLWIYRLSMPHCFRRRRDLVLIENPDAVRAQQGRSNADTGNFHAAKAAIVNHATAAGGAVLGQNSNVDAVLPAGRKGLLRPGNKRGGYVGAMAIHHRCRAGQNRRTIPSGNFGRRPGHGKPAVNFRAAGNDPPFRKPSLQKRTFDTQATAIVTDRFTQQTGTDKNF